MGGYVKEDSKAAGEPKYRYKSITLTEEEKQALGASQEWFKLGDNVRLGGYIPEPDPYGLSINPSFDLVVNGVTNYHWIFWDDLPPQLQDRLMQGEEKG